MDTKKLLWVVGVGAVGYGIYRWYAKDKAQRKTLGGIRQRRTLPKGEPSDPEVRTADIPASVMETDQGEAWRGYGSAQADVVDARAFGSEEAESAPVVPMRAMGDAEEAPDGAGFLDDDEFTKDPTAF